MKFGLPICATRPLRRVVLVAVFATAAASCDESDRVTDAEREGVHLTAAKGASGEAPPADGNGSSARAPAAAGVPAGTGGTFGGAGTGFPAGTGGTFGGAGTGFPAGAGGTFGGNSHRVPIRDAATSGFGVCGGLSTDQFIAKAQQLRPELRDIRQLVYVDGAAGSSSISAYVEPDGRYSLVFRRGDGDCLAGCIDNEYWYIMADDQCAPQQVGYYKRTFKQDNCFAESGLAQWDEPRALDPQYACGANLMPQDLKGSHKLQARGVLQACARSGESVAPVSIDKTITLEIEQDAADPAKATVTVRDLGHPLIDDRELSAEVLRQRVAVHLHESNLPNRCIKESQIDLEYDFEGLASRRLYLMEVDTPDCDNEPDDYCKGFVELSLSPER